MGCFVLLLILAVALIGGAAALYYAGSVFDMPVIPRVEYTPSDGYRAQQKLFELATRDSKRSAEPVVLTEREVNAFLARHLEESADLPFSPIVVRLLPGTIEVQGRTTVVNLFQGFPFPLLAEYLPPSALERPVWVTLSGTIQVQKRRSGTERPYGQLVVSDFSLGNQDLGSWVLSWMLGGKRESLLRWQLPPAVDGITIEQGRVVITPRP
ncbi:MAG: hypothetical protein HYY64_16500 [Candidatus Rokubacteria bacterium]|nr:hypothetical protein [Candidatus Rokubacteria bacterium]